ncbi:hypothetical protein GCM10010452_03810 [Crossiella cryophila]
MTPLDRPRGADEKCSVTGDWCDLADIPRLDPATGGKYWPCKRCGLLLWPVTELPTPVPSRRDRGLAAVGTPAT